MWTVRELDKKQQGKFYYRYDPRQNRQLGDLMTLEEIIGYCKARPTDMYAKNFLRFLDYLEKETVTDKHD